MVEQENPLKNKDQIKFDEELAQRLSAQLQAELEEEERLAKQKEEDANIAEWDDVQAMMDAYYELATRLQAEEKGELTIEERSRLFIELMGERKRHFARLRNMAGYKYNQLKNKSFDEIKKLFDKEMRRVNTFVPMDSEVVEESRKKAEGSGKEALSKKRAGEKLDDESVKRQKIIRADESTKYYKIFSAMLDDFDRQDVLDLYRLVKERFETTNLEGYDKLLWGDIITLFKPSEEDKIWKAQQNYTLIIWRLFDSCGVHLLLMSIGIAIHVLVEKKYPLTQEMLSRMLSRRLEVDHECEMAYELLRFIKSHHKKGGLLGLKDILVMLKLLLLVMKLLLLVIVSTAGKDDTHIWFATGVQQGDPLGPLLFALVLHPLVHKIRDSFKLLIHAWYLDDGTVIEDSEKLREGLFPVDIRRPSLGVKLLGGAVSRDADFISGMAMRRAVNVVDLMNLLP
ncbi:putative ribonuclease H-like domain-containing protein [Tanacetum coccineum]